MSVSPISGLLRILRGQTHIKKIQKPEEQVDSTTFVFLETLMNIHDIEERKPILERENTGLLFFYSFHNCHNHYIIITQVILEKEKVKYQ